MNLSVLPPWAIPLAAIVGAGILYAIHTRQVHNANVDGYTRATTEMQARIAAANEVTAKLEQQQRVRTDQAAAQWETDRNALQSQVDSLLARKPSVRLCKPAAASAVSMPGAPEPATGANDAAVGSVDAVQSGPDVGTQLVQFGAECERYREQLSALQAWVSATR